MRVELRRFTNDSDVDFVLIPDTVGEKTLLASMRGRKSSLLPNSTYLDTLTVRCEVVGKRT